MTSKPSGIQLFACLSEITKKISDTLKNNIDAKQLDSLAKEHLKLTEQLKSVPSNEFEGQKSLMNNLYGQVQSLQDELSQHHQVVKEKLVSFSKKRKQLNAYNAL